MSLDIVGVAALGGGLFLLSKWFFNERKRKKALMKTEIRNIEKAKVVIPQVFDEGQIEAGLRRYRSNQSLLSAFLSGLAERFRDENEIKVIRKKLELLNLGKEYLESAYQAKVAQQKLIRVDQEQAIEFEGKKTDLEIKKLDEESKRIDLAVKRKEAEFKIAQFEQQQQKLKEEKVERKEHVETEEEYRKKIDQDTEKRRIKAQQIETLYRTAEQKFKKWRRDFCSDIRLEPGGSKVRWEREGDWLEDIKKALGEEVDDAIVRYEEYKDRVYEELGLNKTKR